MREVSIPFQAITDMNCGASLEVLLQLDAVTRTFIVPAFFLPSHMNIVTLVTFLLVYSFIHVCLFVCVCGSLVSWSVSGLVT